MDGVMRDGRRGTPDLEPFAGPICGLFAGAVYLAAQMAFAATLHGGAGWEPLQRIAAILLGTVGSSRVDLQACKLEYSIVSPK